MQIIARWTIPDPVSLWSVLFVKAEIFLLPKLLKLFGFPTFRIWVYLMKVIPETRRAH